MTRNGLIIVYLILTAQTEWMCRGEMTETELIDRLIDPAVYNKRERPGKTEGQPVAVEVAIFINSISDISEITMDFTVSLFLRQLWVDRRLAYDNFTDVTFSSMTLHHTYANDIWQPDLYIKNEMSRGGKHDISVPNVMLTLSSTGLIFYSQRVSTTLGCFMQLKGYPMDTQTCSIALESYGHSSKDIIVKWYDITEPLSIAEGLELPEFSLRSNKVTDCTLYYTTGNTTGSWSCVSADFIMDRQFEYYLIQVYIPSIMIVILSWVSFWIDIHAVPARVTLGLLTVLTITTQSSGISAKLPRVSYIKAIDVWMFTCMTFVFGGLIEYSMVNVLARRHSEGGNGGQTLTENDSMSGPLEKYENGQTQNGKINTSNGHVANIQNEKESVTFVSQLPLEEKKTNTLLAWWRKNTSNKAILTDLVSRILFPLSFVIFNVTYWMYYYVFPEQNKE